MKTCKLAFTTLFLIGSIALHAQGWVREFDFDEPDEFVSFQYREDGIFMASKDELVKTDTNANLIWRVDFQHSVEDVLFRENDLITLSNSQEGKHLVAYNHTGAVIFDELLDSSYFYPKLVEIPSNEIVLLNVEYIDNFGERLVFEKRSSNGSLLDKKYLTSDSDQSFVANYTATYLENGSILVFGHKSSYWDPPVFFMMHLNMSGDIVQELTFPPSLIPILRHNVMQASDGNLVLTSSGGESSIDYCTIIKMTPYGEILWRHDYPDNFTSQHITQAVQIPSGNIIFARGNLIQVSPSRVIYRTILTMLDPGGELVWQKELSYFPRHITSERINKLQYLGGNSLAFGGLNSYFSAFDKNMFLVKADTMGNIHNHFIKGKLFHDSLQNCDLDAGEVGMLGWSVFAEGNETFFATTDSSGNYLINLPPGEYNISIPDRPYWSVCQLNQNVVIDESIDTLTANIALQPSVHCPLLQAEISTPFLRLCADGYYTINYCNNGTTPAENATVQVTLADELTYLDATAPLLSQNGQVLTFDLGMVEMNECSSFQVNFEMLCDTTLFGQTLCSEAHAFPDAPCLDDPFNGPIIEANANCTGDSVSFTIKNIGDDMGQPFEYIVIEDNIILRTDQFQLAENEVMAFSEAAQEGSTYHLLATQDTNLPPIFGNHIATASVEGCVGSVNPGAFNQIPQDDGEPWLDVDCHEVVASFDPNDKTGFPTGWQEEHFIDDRTELDYLIRFQNTGTDTAFQVVLIDTISVFLDPATIRPGASSHPYQFELSGQGVVKFIFDNIMLPDSNVNESLSHGFVKFRIAQKSGNQPGTVIENTAGIYFDFNAPVYTNTTFHTIREPWVQVVNGSIEMFEEKMAVKISPNPMGDWAIFEVGNLPPGENMLVLTDAMGREVLRQVFTKDRVLVQREELLAGMYFFKVENDSRPCAAGKLIID